MNETGILFVAIGGLIVVVFWLAKELEQSKKMEETLLRMQLLDDLKKKITDKEKEFNEVVDSYRTAVTTDGDVLRNHEIISSVHDIPEFVPSSEPISRPTTIGTFNGA